MRRVLVLAGWGILAIGSWSVVPAQGPGLVELKARLADASIPADDRASQALEGLASLDQATQKLATASERRAEWSGAVGLLDDFLNKNPGVESAALIQFQAAVYRWAEGRSFAEQFELAPSDAALRSGAVRTLDDAILRLRAISIKPAETAGIFGQNVRFRLAQAIADRAKLEPEGEPGRNSSEREALRLLDSTLVAPGLRPFACLLRGELSNRLGLFGQAQVEIEQAAKLNPSPPAEGLLEARVTYLVGRRQFDEARRAIEGAKVAEPLKDWLSLRMLLTLRREKAPGRERKEVDDEAFRLAEKFRGSNRPEARRALMDLARTIDEPGESGSPDSWDLLAEGHLRLGDPIRAGRLDSKGADRALARSMPEKAASLRFKSGAYLFEAGKFLEADSRLAQVVEAPGAPRDLRARAGMLRALARGRAVATREAGASREAYLASLEAQIHDFPTEASSGEARWLLGQIRLAAGRVDEALTLWSAIPHGHSRWLEARGLIADRLREAVEAQTINRDSAAIASKMDLARKALRSALDVAIEGTEIVTLTLQMARLELTPDAGRPAQAIELCDRVLKSAARPEDHRMARAYRMVALAEAGRSVEAEQAARNEAKNDDPAYLLPALRLLDRSASDAEVEMSRRRLGLIARVLTNRLMEHLDQLPAPLQDEIRLHHARAILFAGDPAGAKREIAAWGGPTGVLDEELLRELADTYQRLDAFSLAIDAERYRSSRLSPGSLPWFESRYGIALAYFRADRPKDARQIIDATAILHPDLGGGQLRTKFERLRQRIGQN